MTSNPYTPDEAELIGCYAGVMEESGENFETAQADAERGIAKLKAEALREAANALPKPVGLRCNPECHTADWASLRVRADRIEAGEA